MTIKMSVVMFNSAIFDAYQRGIERGHTTGQQQADDTVRSLLAENNQLKAELSRIESEAARRVTRAENELKEKSYPAVREEQLRIVKGIRDWCNKNNYAIGADLLFWLGMGDIK